MEKNTVAHAREFAIKAHGDQKYGEHPYIVHLDEVADIVRSIPTSTENMIAAAYLHDTVEDTDTTLQDIIDVFGFVVGTYVAFCTDEEGPNRRERKRRTYRRNREILAGDSSMDREAALVKLADRLANIRSCVREKNQGLLDMYRKEGEAFYLAHYIQGHNDLWDEYDSLLADK